MKKSKLMAIVLSALMTVSVFTGCKDKPVAGNDTSEMDKDQYLNLVLPAEPKTLDGGKGTDGYSATILNAITEGLTRIEQDNNGKDVIKAAGAESWKVSEDKLTWTFKLRDYQWQDGQPVKASDFEYGIKRSLAPETASQYAFLLFPIKGASAYNGKKGTVDQVGVKALDDKTLEIKLEGPCPYFLDITYFKVMYPMRKDLVEKYGDKYGTEAETLLSCGPYLLKEWAHASKFELVKNEKYWDAKTVKMNKITYKIITDENSRMQELFNGSLDSAAVSNQNWIEKFDKLGKHNNIKGYDPSVTYIFFNQTQAPFNNVKVRKAFSLAVTREDYVKTLYRGLGAPAYGWCPPTLQLDGKDFRDRVNFEPLKKLAEEVKDPKALLIEGLKELGLDPDPSKLTITTLESGTKARDREFAEYTQQMWHQALGVNVKSEYVEWPVFQQRTEKLEYQVGSMMWTGDYNDPMTMFDMWVSTAGMVPTGWSNKTYDDLIKKAASTADQTVRLEAFKECEKILLYDDAVIAPTAYVMRNTYRAKYVKGIMAPLFGNTELKYAYTAGRPAK